MAELILYHGQTEITVTAFLRDAMTGQPANRAHNAAGARAYYTRDGEELTAIPLVALSSLEQGHLPGGWMPKSLTIPGAHRFDLPDELAEGTPRTGQVVVEFDGVIAWKMDLVFMPYDVQGSAPVAPADIADATQDALEAPGTPLARLAATLDPTLPKFTATALEDAPVGSGDVDEAAIASAVRADLERVGGPIATVHERLTATRAALLDNLARLTVDVNDVLSAANAAKASADLTLRATDYVAPDNSGIAAAKAAAEAAAIDAGSAASVAAAIQSVTDRLGALLDPVEPKFTQTALEEAPTASGDGVTDWSPAERQTILDSLASILSLASEAGVKVDPSLLAPLAKTADLAPLAKTADLTGLATTSDLASLADKGDVSAIRGDIANVEATVDLTGIARTTDVTSARDSVLSAVTEVEEAIGSLDLSALADLATIRSVTDKLNTALEQVGATYRLTATALSQAPQPDVAGALAVALEPVAKTAELAPLARTSDLAPVAKTSDLADLATAADLANLATTSDLAPLATAAGLTAVRDALAGDVQAVRDDLAQIPAQISVEVSEGIADSFVDDFLNTVVIAATGAQPAVTIRQMLGTLLGGYEIEGDYLIQRDDQGGTARRFLVQRDRQTGAVTGLVPA